MTKEERGQLMKTKVIRQQKRQPDKQKKEAGRQHFSSLHILQDYSYLSLSLLTSKKWFKYICLYICIHSFPLFFLPSLTSFLLHFPLKFALGSGCFVFPSVKSPPSFISCCFSFSLLCLLFWSWVCFSLFYSPDAVPLVVLTLVQSPVSGSCFVYLTAHLSILKSPLIPDCKHSWALDCKERESMIP